MKKLTAKDLKAIAIFNEILFNYEKMIRIENKNNEKATHPITDPERRPFADSNQLHDIHQTCRKTIPGDYFYY